MVNKSQGQMDGSSIQEFLSKEVTSLLAKYKQFETIVPHRTHKGSNHPGEEGRSIESLVRSCLRTFLPENLGVTSGFILRPAVKTGVDGRERRGEKDEYSKQLDVLVFDKPQYPSFQKFEDVWVVPPEGVIGIVSVKKTLTLEHISDECTSLFDAAKLCRTLDKKDKPRRGPYLAIIGMRSKEDSSKLCHKGIFQRISSAYQNTEAYFDEVVGYVGVIGECGVFKSRPSKKEVNRAEFIWQDYKEEEEHLALQFLITGILSVYYDPTRCRVRRPGFTAFPSGRKHDGDIGHVSVKKLR